MGVAGVAAFPDHFSAGAEEYARYRPRYPAALFSWLASLVARRDLAWDAATGNGQAAVALAGHFARVVASDGSVAQLARAEAHARVAYRVATAERSDLASASVDLATAAQAAHWFDPARWHAELRRVVRPGGVVAAWCYGLPAVDEEVDARLAALYAEVGPDWPPERRLVEDGYRSLPFPFAEVPAPPFSMEVDWTAAALVAYVGTWSAVARHRERTGRDPVGHFAGELARAWPERGRRRVRFPLCLRAGRVDPAAEAGASAPAGG